MGLEEAAARNTPPGGGVFDLFYSLLLMLAGLGVVLGLIFLVAWLAKKYLPAARRAVSGPEAISIVSVKSLGPRRSLMVVRARGRCFLLGATPNSITCLADLDFPSGAEPPEASSADFQAELDLAGIRNQELRIKD